MIILGENSAKNMFFMLKVKKYAVGYCLFKNNVYLCTRKTKMGSLLYRAATTCYLCCDQALEDSQGAGRIGPPVSFASAKVDIIFE